MRQARDVIFIVNPFSYQPLADQTEIHSADLEKAIMFIAGIG